MRLRTDLGREGGVELNLPDPNVGLVVVLRPGGQVEDGVLASKGSKPSDFVSDVPTRIS